MPGILDIDQLAGEVSFGNFTEVGANTFSRFQIPDAIISPDIIIDGDLFKDGSLKIDDVLVWDVHEWEPTTLASPDLVGGEDTNQRFQMGLVKDNSVTANLPPTADSFAQDTRPGGDSTGGFTRYAHRWNWNFGANEQQAADGQINRFVPEQQKRIPVVMQTLGTASKRRNYGEPLSAAHYHIWGQGAALGVAQAFGLGVRARRIQLEFEELLFDRNTLLGILGLVTNIVI